MPFFERFRLCLQLTQGDDLARLGDGAVTGWLVSTNVGQTLPSSERRVGVPP